jgi:hypothetical protein
VANKYCTVSATYIPVCCVCEHKYGYDAKPGVLTKGAQIPGVMSPVANKYCTVSATYIPVCCVCEHKYGYDAKPGALTKGAQILGVMSPVATKYCTVSANICRSSVRNLLHVTLMAPIC